MSIEQDIIEVKPCWYCNTVGHYKIVSPERGGRFALCECGASTVYMPKLKVVRNKLGGVRKVIFT